MRKSLNRWYIFFPPPPPQMPRTTARRRRSIPRARTTRWSSSLAPSTDAWASVAASRRRSGSSVAARTSRPSWIGTVPVDARAPCASPTITSTRPNRARANSRPTWTSATCVWKVGPVDRFPGISQCYRNKFLIYPHKCPANVQQIFSWISFHLFIRNSLILHLHNRLWQIYLNSILNHVSLM